MDKYELEKIKLNDLEELAYKTMKNKPLENIEEIIKMLENKIRSIQYELNGVRKAYGEAIDKSTKQ